MQGYNFWGSKTLYTMYKTKEIIKTYLKQLFQLLPSPPEKNKKIMIPPWHINEVKTHDGCYKEPNAF
jgi:hypothetical protein